MTIKEDNLGFRGHYIRNNKQIYLSKKKYPEVVTFEPIHKLIEESTYDDMNKRIDIKECISYLELQKRILNCDTKDQELEYIIKKLQYEERSKERISQSEATELVYKGKNDIYKLLDDIISISNIYITSSFDEEKNVQIQVSNFSYKSNGECQFIHFINGKKIKEYLFKIKKLIYSKLDETSVIELDDFNFVSNEYVQFQESKSMFGRLTPKIYLSSHERIIITKP